MSFCTEKNELPARYSQTCCSSSLLSSSLAQFGAQEPGTAAEIKSFTAKYGVKFPVFAKVEVNGENAHPLYKWMKDETTTMGLGGFANIKWNFGKFLIDKEGKVVERYAPTSSPFSITPDIDKYL